MLLSSSLCECHPGLQAGIAAYPPLETLSLEKWVWEKSKITDIFVNKQWVYMRRAWLKNGSHGQGWITQAQMSGFLTLQHELRARTWAGNTAWKLSLCTDMLMATSTKIQIITVISTYCYCVCRWDIKARIFYEFTPIIPSSSWLRHNEKASRTVLGRTKYEKKGTFQRDILDKYFPLESSLHNALLLLIIWIICHNVQFVVKNSTYLLSYTLIHFHDVWHSCITLYVPLILILVKLSFKLIFGRSQETYKGVASFGICKKCKLLLF